MYSRGYFLLLGIVFFGDYVRVCYPSQQEMEALIMVGGGAGGYVVLFVCVSFPRFVFGRRPRK